MSTTTITNGLAHLLPAELLQRQITVHLVGCGGTGSQMLSNLARLHLALVALGHPAGLHVSVFDPDRVAPSNVGRQLFSRADIGFFKSDILVNRINAYFGLTWRSDAVRYEVAGCAPGCDIVITCVDTAHARRQIGTAMMRLLWQAPIYWLDCGNSVDSGQVILTELREPVLLQTLASEPYPGNQVHKEREDMILPPLWVALPDVFDASIPEDDRPSCSLADALGEQGLFINSHVAHWGSTLLERLLREGGLDQHGYYINLVTGVVPVPVPRPQEQDPAALIDPAAKVVTNG